MHPSVRYSTLAILTASLCIMPSAAQKTTGPKARYEMDVQTMSGMGIGAMMGGGLGGILGGGGGDNHMIDLRLTSTVPAPQQPEKGDHFFLPAAKMGKSVPLLGDTPGTPQPIQRDYDRGGMPEKPKGRILMFWGCHETAPKGQPFIIDFAKMPTAKMPPMGMPSGGMARYEAEARSRDANAAWWPNGKDGKQPKSGSSLIGEHRIASNFTPEIKFSLTNSYMDALNVNASEGTAILLNWNSIANATGYAAWAMGGMENAGSGGDMVIWSSSNNREFYDAMGWLSPAEVQKQIGLKNVMPPTQTSCAIPAEAKTAAAGMMFGSMNAFGPEENFAFPPKPADPKAVWNIEWTSKARFKSFGSFMTGMGGRGMGSAPAKPKEKKPCKGPFGVPIPGTSC